MIDAQQTVFLVDDDGAMRESMAMMLDLAGFRVRTFASALEFLDACAPGQSASLPGCLVVDLRMPEMTGLELQQTLADQGFTLPTIFLSAYGDVPTTVRAIKGGAVDFLEKPVANETLIGRIREALEADRRQRETAQEEIQVRARWGELTPREREVMALVIRGQANKEIARHLGISPRTVENHRARVMEKMQAGNVAELCRMAALCLIPEETPAV